MPIAWRSGLLSQVDGFLFSGAQGDISVTKTG
jgi:hypothetical protein